MPRRARHTRLPADRSRLLDPLPTEPMPQITHLPESSARQPLPITHAHQTSPCWPMPNAGVPAAHFPARLAANREGPPPVPSGARCRSAAATTDEPPDETAQHAVRQRAGERKRDKDGRKGRGDQLRQKTTSSRQLRPDSPRQVARHAQQRPCCVSAQAPPVFRQRHSGHRHRRAHPYARK